MHIIHGKYGNFCAYFTTRINWPSRLDQIWATWACCPIVPYNRNNRIMQDPVAGVSYSLNVGQIIVNNTISIWILSLTMCSQCVEVNEFRVQKLQGALCLFNLFTDHVNANDLFLMLKKWQQFDIIILKLINNQMHNKIHFCSCKYTSLNHLFLKGKMSW